MQPRFAFVNGRARPLRPVRTRTAALDRIIERLRASMPSERNAYRLHVAALHALDVEAATGLLEQVREQFQRATAFTAAFSAVMVGHTGPGLVGLSWWWEPPASAGPSNGP